MADNEQEDKTQSSPPAESAVASEPSPQETKSSARTETSEITGSGVSTPPQTTRETAKNQADTAKTSLPQRIQRRQREINELLTMREQLVLKYVYERVPKPYYERWKAESNDAFTLLVRLKHRRSKPKASP